MAHTIRELIAGIFPTFDATEYCVKCNHFTEHTEVRLPDRTAWVCKTCDEVHTSKEPEG